MANSRSTQAPEIEEVQSRFEQWRQARQGKAPIPDELWAAAAAVASRDGINRTAAALHLDVGKLKRRMTNPGSRKCFRVSFSELERPTPPVGGTGFWGSPGSLVLKAIPKDLHRRLTPNILTTVDLKSVGPISHWGQPGFYRGDPQDFTDLVNFWNLRACDIDAERITPVGHLG